MTTEPTDDLVLYSSNVFVRTRRPWNSWISWNGRLGGGPNLVVRANSFELSSPQGMVLESRDVTVQSSEATMWIDKIGWAGTPFDRRECIHVAGRVRRRRIDLALSPRDGLDEAWKALLASGVAPCGASV
jgi:hypothetical protein